ncbi:hypothetical protein LX36DRAFT_181115 [Colletotrichum falcatum]|nr:hypothetical protein LX36DRAFT_181115 [Colletotrichum falcatum]
MGPPSPPPSPPTDSPTCRESGWTWHRGRREWRGMEGNGGRSDGRIAASRAPRLMATLFSRSGHR